MSGTFKSSYILNPDPASPLLAHIPHTSINIPEQLRSQIILPDNELVEQLRLLTDWHTEELYSPIVECGGSAVVFNLSRFIVDPERFEDDSQEVMAKRGMGVIYRSTTDQKPLRRTLSAEETAELIGHYRYHHQLLTDMTEKIRAKFGFCILIDCHSYPEHALTYEISPTAERPEICIGTDSFHTPALVTEVIEDLSHQAGYSVGLDKPFTGTLVPMKFYKKDPAVISVMLEINRSIYMDESTSSKNSGFNKTRSLIADICSSLKTIKAPA